MRTRPGRPSVSKVDQPLAFPAHCIARTLDVTGCHFGEPEAGVQATGLIPNVNVVWDDGRGDRNVAASVRDVLTLQEEGRVTHSDHAPSHLKKMGGSMGGHALRIGAGVECRGWVSEEEGKRKAAK